MTTNRSRPATRHRGLRLPRHRATTAHLPAIYPFHATPPADGAGVFLGFDLLSGTGGFCFDPFEAYTAGQVTNPNMVIIGEPGAGKSTVVKTFLHRTVGLFGTGTHRRWVAICDPKGEYGPLAETLGLQTLTLRPGGTARLNPLDCATHRGVDRTERLEDTAAMINTLAATVVGRPLDPLEDAALTWATTAAVSQPAATLVDVAHLLAAPTAAMVERATMAESTLVDATRAVRFGLEKLLDRDLRGMFDGPSTVSLDHTGRGLVIDLSAVHARPDALATVMVAATGWLQSIFTDTTDGDVRRIQVLDEAWALLGAERTARYLQRCWKLGRAYGVANIAVAHRISDLRAQADDGTATAKVTMGLLADTQTRVVLRQAHDQLADATAMLGLTEREADLLPRLPRGRALWKIAGRTAVVDHVVAPAEDRLTDTDAHLTVGR
jgi:type IV secretory pathway VirB4 component